MRVLPPAHYLRRLLSYDPATGALLWRIRPSERWSDKAKGNTWNTRYAGKPAGTMAVNGYLRVSIDDRVFMAHRLIWVILHGIPPLHDIDHIDGNPSNNCIGNLRAATRAENLANQRRRNSGVKGVWYDSERGRYQAHITHLHKQYHLGRFDTFEQAISARREAAVRLNGRFARHE